VRASPERRACAAADRRRGTSLLELVIALSLTVTLLLLAIYLVRGAGDSLESGISSNEIDGMLRRALGRVNEDLQLSGSATDGADQVISHPIAVTTDTDSITFRRRIGLAEDSSDWSTPITYSLLPSMNELAANGYDDDGDGLIDERILVRSQDSDLSVVADNITSATFRRDPGEYRVDVAFTVAKASRHEGDVISRTVESTVALRNRRSE